MGAGFGSTTYFRTAIMTKAFMEGRAYLYYGRFNYALNSHCSAKGQHGSFECYFEPVAPNCTGTVEALRSAFRFPSPSQRGPRGEDCILDHGKEAQGCKAGEGYHTIPARFARRGLFWWRMVQVASLVRPNRETLDLLDLGGLKQRIGYEHPIIGVHMRSGDGCRYGIRARLFKCRTLEDYLPEIRAMALKYGTTRVFLATDDAGAVRDSRRLTEFSWAYAPADRSALTSDVKIEQRLAGQADKGATALDHHSVMLDTLRDLYLLAEADFLVTHQASTLSRLALQLGTALHRRVPPFISMDGPWCPHWRMCCDPDHRTGRSIEC